MDTFKKILAGLIIAISVIGVAICAFGIFKSWQINTPTTIALTQTLTGVEQILTVADNSLGEVNTALASVKTNVEEVETRIIDAGDTIADEGLLSTLIENRFGEIITPKMEAARETSAALANSIIAFNDMLVAANEVPFVNIPTLDDQLQAVTDSIAEARTAVAETRAELVTMRNEKLSGPTTRITDRTTQTINALDTAQTRIDTTQQNLTENIETTAAVRERIPGIIDLISFAITFLLFWIGLANAGLILHSYWYLKDISPLQS